MRSCKQRETGDLLLLRNYLYTVSFSWRRLLVAQLVETLRYSRKVAGSIPDGVIETLNTGNISGGGVKAAGA